MAVLRYLGLARETVFNPAVPPPATFFVDIASASLDAPADTQIIYEGGLTRGVRMHRPGFYAPTGNIVYAFDIRTIAFLLRCALGGYRFTAGTPLNTHEIWSSSGNVMPSFTARLGKDHFEHVFSGCVINSLEITVEGEYCMATTDVIAARDARTAIASRESIILPAEYPLVFHEVKASIAGTDRSADVKSLTLSIGNNLSVEAGRGLGSRHPYRIPAQNLDVTLSMDLWYENTVELQRYWGGATGPVLGGSEEFPITLNFDSGAHGDMIIELPRVAYSSVQQQPAGRGEITQSVEGRAFLATVPLMAGGPQVNTEILTTVTNGQGNLTT
jgi:hypothetical protein